MQLERIKRIKIIQGTIDSLASVHEIVQATIQAVYPHYYPSGALEFFGALTILKYLLVEARGSTAQWAVEWSSEPASATTRPSQAINLTKMVEARRIELRSIHAS